jgi:hypothetical protein
MRHGRDKKGNKAGKTKSNRKPGNKLTMENSINSIPQEHDFIEYHKCAFRKIACDIKGSRDRWLFFTTRPSENRYIKCRGIFYSPLFNMVEIIGKDGCADHFFSVEGFQGTFKQQHKNGKQLHP